MPNPDLILLLKQFKSWMLNKELADFKISKTEQDKEGEAYNTVHECIKKEWAGGFSFIFLSLC